MADHLKMVTGLALAFEFKMSPYLNDPSFLAMSFPILQILIWLGLGTGYMGYLEKDGRGIVEVRLVRIIKIRKS